MSETEPVAAPAPDQSPAPEPAPDGVEALIARWFNEHVANSAITRGPVDLVNDLTQRAIPALVAMLKKEG